jgi:hypothetical protein
MNQTQTFRFVLDVIIATGGSGSWMEGQKFWSQKNKEQTNHES